MSILQIDSKPPRCARVVVDVPWQGACQSAREKATLVGHGPAGPARGPAPPRDAAREARRSPRQAPCARLGDAPCADDLRVLHDRAGARLAAPSAGVSTGAAIGVARSGSR